MSEPTDQETPVVTPHSDPWVDLALTVVGALVGWFARHFSQGKTQ